MHMYSLHNLRKMSTVHFFKGNANADAVLPGSCLVVIRAYLQQCVQLIEPQQVPGRQAQAPLSHRRTGDLLGSCLSGCN